jgi:ATP-binding cassette subfamily C protein
LSFFTAAAIPLMMSRLKRPSAKAAAAPATRGSALVESSSMLRAFRLFFQAPGSQPFIVLACLIVAGFAEALSFGALVPAVALIETSSSALGSPIIELTRNAFGRLGIPVTIGALTAFVAIGMTVKAALSFGAIGIAARARVRLLTVLRQNLIEALLAARWSYFADQRFGKIANTIGTDIMNAGNAYIAAARYIAGLFQTFALAVVAFLISWKAMAVGIAIAFLLVILLRGFLGSSYRSGLTHFRRTADLVALLVDTLNNLKALKAMNRNEPVAALMAKHSHAAQRARLKQELLKTGLQNSQVALTAIIFSAALYFAATTLRMPLAGLIGLGVFVFRIVQTFAKSQSFLQLVTESEGGYWRTLECIENIRSAAEDDIGTLVPTLDHGCVFENVSFSHAAKPILIDVNLEIPKSAITVLQGVSGAGKTTTIDLLTGLHRPSSGRILIDGVDLRDISLRRWRSMIGYVPQELTLFHTTVAENITLGNASLDDEQIWHALALAGAAEFIRELPRGLLTDVGEMGSKLSGGQRQRIAIARAIVSRPQLLILDEVTSALDPATERDICERISSLGDDFTIVAITHRPAWTAIAARVYNLADGKVREVESSRRSGRIAALGSAVKAEG